MLLKAQLWGRMGLNSDFSPDSRFETLGNLLNPLFRSGLEMGGNDRHLHRIDAGASLRQ